MSVDMSVDFYGTSAGIRGDSKLEIGNSFLQGESTFCHRNGKFTQKTSVPILTKISSEFQTLPHQILSGQYFIFHFYGRF